MADDGDTNGSFTTEDIAGAVSAALQARDVPTDGDDVSVSISDGLFHVSVRLSATVKPAGQAPPADGDADPGSVQAAPLLLIGTVQVVDDAVRVGLRIVVTETSQIVESAGGDATGTTAEAVTDAAQIALGGLPSLNA